MHKYGNRIDAWYAFLSRPICCRGSVVFCGPGTVATYGSLLLETELPQSLSILMSCHFIKTCTKILSLEAKYPIEENIHLGIIGEILVHEQNAGFYGEKRYEMCVQLFGLIFKVTLVTF